MTTTISLNEATAAQLADWANVNLGFEVDFRKGKDKIAAMVIAARPDLTEIEVAEAPSISPGGGHPGKPIEIAPQDKVRLIINEGSDLNGGDKPVWVAVNGRGMWIPRGKEVSIPYPYFEALQHAVTRVPIKDRNDGITGWREVPYYQYSVLGTA